MMVNCVFGVHASGCRCGMRMGKLRWCSSQMTLFDWFDVLRYWHQQNMRQVDAQSALCHKLPPLVVALPATCTPVPPQSLGRSLPAHKQVTGKCFPNQRRPIALVSRRHGLVIGMRKLRRS
eukprot:1189029-Prorocentrum_minimum.AAC.5